MIYVYSTLTCNNNYCSYDTQGSGAARANRCVMIKGGANAADKAVHTPKGVVTQISEDDFEFLKTVKAFQDHVDLGFLTYEKTRADPDKVARDMKPKDQSAPITPEAAVDELGATPEVKKKSSKK